MPQGAPESEMRPRGPSEKEQWALMGRYGTVGIEMGLCVVFGWWFGVTFDEWFATAPIGLNLGLLFGVAAAFNALWRMYRVIVREQETAAATNDDTADP